MFTKHFLKDRNSSGDVLDIFAISKATPTSYGTFDSASAKDIMLLLLN